jgi:hypothetical protein
VPINLRGDVNEDFTVDQADLDLLTSYIGKDNVTISENGLRNADANEDGSVDISDNTYISIYIEDGVYSDHDIYVAPPEIPEYTEPEQITTLEGAQITASAGDKRM